MCNSKLAVLLTVLLLSACSTTRQTTEPVAGASAGMLQLCKMTVSNPPNEQTRRGSRLVCDGNVKLDLLPAPGACISSGFGQRWGRLHAGIDFQSKPAGPVVAAADGKIIDIAFRSQDFGRWVILEHRSGIYTSYAHLANIERNLTAGDVVSRGQKLGVIGNSGASASAIHLHYELRKGNYSNPKGWWGLLPVDPFSLPSRCG